MRLRLAFGVIAQLEPDLLLLDEVIAVGDLGFQRRCMDRIAELRRGGTALLLASHSLEQVVEECDRAIWMERGQARAQGPAEEVVQLYRTAMHDETRARTPARDRRRGAARRARAGPQPLRQPGGRDPRRRAERRSTACRSSRSPSAAGWAWRSRSSQLNGALDQPVVGVTITRAADELTCYDTSTDGEGLALGRVGEAVQATPGVRRARTAAGRVLGRRRGLSLRLGVRLRLPLARLRLSRRWQRTRQRRLPPGAPVGAVELSDAQPRTRRSPSRAPWERASRRSGLGRCACGSVSAAAVRAGRRSERAGSSTCRYSSPSASASETTFGS